MWIEIIFWLSLIFVFYTYIGYGMLLFILVKIKRFIFKNENEPRTPIHDYDWPIITHVIAAYNEEPWIENKLLNCLQLDYPLNKIYHLFVTDGSTDQTVSLIKSYVQNNPHISHHHKEARAGKIAAIERVMPLVKTSIVVFSDANTELNKKSMKNIVKHYQNPSVGAVAGEKRINQTLTNDAAGAGEGIYWKYESQLKKWDGEFYSVVGAAGELFSIRRELYQPVAHDTIIEDFVMTLSIAAQGYRIAYADDAYASEGQSANVEEELKRKIRIAAGGLQAFWRLKTLLNPFKHGRLTFQYLSHRIGRWTLAPLALPLIFIANFYLAFQGEYVYKVLFLLQIAFYFLAIIGFAMERRKIKIKAFFIPFYFVMMNYAVYRGFGRIIRGNQSVVWARAKRA